jgi:molybdate transport system ATP-binding protein
MAHEARVTGLAADVRVTVGTLVLDVDIAVQPGETVAVLGPNGAGKTTLLRALAGLVPIDAGRIDLGGDVLDDPAVGQWCPPEQRPIGFVFQDHLLFPYLRAIDNVAFGLRARGATRTDAHVTAQRWLDRVGLAAQARHRPAQLSGGQAQRVALARALACEPTLLLLDEPLAALDAATRLAVRRDLRRHLDQFAGVAVLVTHDPVEAAALADRLVVIEAGRVLQVGTAAEISAHPRSPYVADLVGVNLLRGTATGRQVRLSTATLTIADDADGDVLAVVHPRAVTVHRRRPEGSARNVWPASVVAVDRDRDGDRVRVSVVGQVSLVAEVTATAADELGLSAGEEVWVSVKATEIDVSPA